MDNYLDIWCKFTEELYMPEEYYELTIGELANLCADFHIRSTQPGTVNVYDWIGQWLKENLK